MEQVQRSLVTSPDNKRTMTPTEMFESDVASTDYAINALSHPSDDTYRKNLAKYLDTKGYDLVSKDRQLYIGDRNSMNTRPVTKGFLGDMIGSSPEIAGSILGAYAGSTVGPVGTLVGAVSGAVGGDSVQQLINNYFLGEDLTTGERVKEVAKSGGLALGGEVAGHLVGRAITPLRDLNKATHNTNLDLASKYDVPLTPATATGHDGLSRFEEVMSKGTIGGKKIVQMKEAEVTGIENTARDLLENKMGATGDVSNSGASFAYNVDKNQQIAQDYFNTQYGQLIQDAGVTQIPVGSLRGTADKILQLSEKIPAFKNGIDSLAERIIQSPKTLSYEEYSQLRTFIGAKIKDASVTGQSGSKEAYKNLYKAINEDFDNVFKGTSLWDSKKILDEQFKGLYKEPFEDSFTKGILGTSRNKIDEERIGGLLSNSSTKATTSMNTADSIFGFNGGRPVESMSTAADYILGKSVAPNGGMSLSKIKTNLGGGGSMKAKGIDKLLERDNMWKSKLGADTGSSLATPIDRTNLKVMKDDIIKLVELSGANKQVANTSGTAWMNEMLRMKNDPMSALVGFFADQTISRAYKNQTIQKWLTNDLITRTQAQELINATTQVGVRSGQE